MGSPLSAVGACLFMEMLESEHYNQIIPNDAKWFRYVDDCLVIVNKDSNLDILLNQMNQVYIHNKIQFTIEKESDGALPFLDTVIIRAENTVKFKVYRKPTNKDDFVNYFSAHDERTKSGIVIGFYLRALRICSQEFVNKEITYINQAFEKLGYPKGLLTSLLDKARKIRQRGEKESRDKVGYLVVPNSNLANIISRALRPTGLIVVCDTGKKIGELVKEKGKKCESVNSVVYKIPCNGCDRSYYGETSKGLDKRVTQHRSDVRYHRTTSAIVNHIDNKQHLPNWREAEILEKGMEKQQRKVVEALYIAINENINQRTGDIKWCMTSAAYTWAERIRKGGQLRRPLPDNNDPVDPP